MKINHQNESKWNGFLFWSPRILAIAAILFISIFSLDAFAPGYSIGEQIVAFLMHMIPAFLLTALLLYTWKHEKWGGVLFLLIGLIFTPLIFNKNFQMNNSVWISLSIVAIITLPFIIVGLLFLTHNYLQKKNLSSKP